MKKSAVSAMVALMSLVFIVVPATSFAGGTITGKVTYAGKSEEKEFLFSKYPNAKFCAKNPKKALVRGEKRIMPTIEVSKDGGLKAAIVAIRDIEDKAFMDSYKGTDVVAEFCEFMPFTGVVVRQKNFHVENHDNDPDDPKSVKGVFHTAHLFEMLRSPFDILQHLSYKTVFNVILAEKGSKLDKPVKDVLIFRLGCDQHEFMQSFFLPVTNPHYAVAGEDGSFEIKDVPAGKHWLTVWHPFAGEVSMQVDVPEGGKTEVKAQLGKR